SCQRAAAGADVPFGGAWPAVSSRSRVLQFRQTVRIDRAICRAVADGHRAPSTTPRCCRRSSIARRPFGEIPSDIGRLVVFPLAGPFPAQCLNKLSQVWGSLQLWGQSEWASIGGPRPALATSNAVVVPSRRGPAR